MSKSQETAPREGRGRRTAARDAAALRNAKLTLVTAHERGEPDALASALRAFPAQADALGDFAMALTATESYNDEAITPDVSEIAARARARAFTAVFGATADVAPAPATAQARSLKALRQARGVTMAAAARALGLGVDVLSALEAGRIRVATAPRRLTEALGELLDATADQINAALGAQVAPALRRGALDAARTGASPETSEQLNFTDAVLLSKNMTAEEKARWLAENGGTSHPS
jgi:transcriptional regulator with XRE-family HTH domain